MAQNYFERALASQDKRSGKSSENSLSHSLLITVIPPTAENAWENGDYQGSFRRLSPLHRCDTVLSFSPHGDPLKTDRLDATPILAISRLMGSCPSVSGMAVFCQDSAGEAVMVSIAHVLPTRDYPGHSCP
jgi:hypothetical protein